MTMLIQRAPSIATATAILLAIAWAWRRHVRPRAARPQTVSAGRIVVAASLLDTGGRRIEDGVSRSVSGWSSR